MKKKDFSEIIDILKVIEKTDSQSKIAVALGITPQNLNSYLARGTLPYEHLIDYCYTKGISFWELLTGEEDHFENSSEKSSIGGEKKVSESDRIEEFQRQISDLRNQVHDLRGFNQFLKEENKRLKEENEELIKKRMGIVEERNTKTVV